MRDRERFEKMMTDVTTENEGKFRYVEFGKTKVKFSCLDDPYGFWSITYNAGTPPAHLRGKYTTFDQAHKAFLEYASKMNIEVGGVYRPDARTAAEAMVRE